MWWGTVADRPHFFFPSKDDNFFFFLWSCFMKSVKRWINKIEWATLQRYYTQYDNNTNTIWVLFEAFSPILKFVLGRNSSFFSQNKYIFYWPRTKLVLKKKIPKMQARQNTAQLVKILSDTTHQNVWPLFFSAVFVLISHKAGKVKRIVRRSARSQLVNQVILQHKITNCLNNRTVSQDICSLFASYLYCILCSW